MANASDALGILAEGDQQFELVFSEVVMPGMNGLEMARVVRDRYPGIPVVLTSGYSDALTEGFEDFKLVKKPYSVEVLSRVLQTALVGRL